MEQGFWQARWARNEIGFHTATVNEQLTDAFDRIHPDFPARRPQHALVPLCGKTLDLHWLAARCGHVTGVEFVEQAVIDFFAEAGLKPVETLKHPLHLFRSDNITLARADFFHVSQADAVDVDFYYDRAALIALPTDLRDRYVAHLTEILPSGCEGLVVTIDYDPAVRGGPPFPVTDEVLTRLYEPGFVCERLDRRLVRDAPRGLEENAFTSTWHVRRR